MCMLDALTGSGKCRIGADRQRCRRKREVPTGCVRGCGLASAGDPQGCPPAGQGARGKVTLQIAREYRAPGTVSPGVWRPAPG